MSKLNKALLITASTLTLVIAGVSSYALYKVCHSDAFGIEVSREQSSVVDVELTGLIPGQKESFSYQVINTSLNSKFVLEFSYKEEQGLLPFLNAEIAFDDEIKYTGKLTELVDNHRTLRLYKDDIKWWNGWDVSNEERIFFYVEVKCEEHLDFYLQRTLKVYSKNLNTKANRYALSMNEKLVKHKYMNTYKVFERIKILSNYQPLSNEWKNDLFTQIEDGLKQLIIRQQEEVQKFDNFN